MLQTYGSLDFGIRVPSSLIRSLMLNRRLLSTAEKQGLFVTHKQEQTVGSLRR